MSSVPSSNLTSGFVDLATYDELETYFAGGENAITYFVRGVKKTSWFTLVPTQLTLLSGGTPNFASTWSCKVTRGGDYLVNAWLRLTLPSVAPNTSSGTYGANTRLRWCANFMHNLINEASITFNNITEARFDNWCLDFWAAYTVPAGKQNAYANMIGNVLSLTNPLAQSPPSSTLPQRVLNLPLPLPHCRDSGVALPTAALPYNEIAINFKFNNWNTLLITDDIANGVSSAAVLADISGGVAPSLSDVYCWATYAIVSNQERKKMGASPRDILIEQFQTAPVQNYVPTNVSQISVHFSHAVKVVFFGVQNKTNSAEQSNYTAASPVPSATGIYYDVTSAVDPIQSVSLQYESTYRLQNMPVDYHSLVAPFYHATVVPLETGYHLYSYSLFFPDVNPKGSTNYGKLTNVGFTFNPSAGALTGAAGSGAVGSGQNTAQTYQSIIIVVNNNVVRVSGGALGFPVL